MSIGLAIQSFGGANACVKRHWPYYEKSGVDQIIGIGTTDGKCEWPEGITVENIGADLYCVGAHLPKRFLRTLAFMLNFTKHETLAICEYDTLFFREIPKNLPIGLTAHLAGGKPEGCHCNQFWHGVWCVDRITAQVILEAGHQILQSGRVDPSPDCFIGQIVELAEIPTHNDILKSYSRNTIHGFQWISEARSAIENGAVCIHGVKSNEVLQEIIR